MKGFITIEGCDGVGKTYQTTCLREYCKKNGYDNVVFTREPGGSDIAEQIRKIILDAKNEKMSDLCEAFLYSASRIQHLQDIVIPALNAGKTVFCRQIRTFFIRLPRVGQRFRTGQNRSAKSTCRRRIYARIHCISRSFSRTGVFTQGGRRQDRQNGKRGSSIPSACLSGLQISY